MVKKKTSRKPSLRNRNILILTILVVVIAVMFSGYKLRQIIEKQREDAYVASLNPCTELSDGQIAFANSDGKTFLKDEINNYSLNVSNLPEINFSDKPECANRSYELELYKKRNDDGFLGSIARVGFTPPVVVNSNSSLEEIAKSKFDYIEGKHTDPKGGNYGQPFTSTPLQMVTLASSVKVISWENLYTDQPTHREGTTAAKQYLILVGDKLYSFHLFSWDTPSFDKAVSDFDRVITSFQSPIN